MHNQRLFHTHIYRFFPVHYIYRLQPISGPIAPFVISSLYILSEPTLNSSLPRNDTLRTILDPERKSNSSLYLDNVAAGSPQSFNYHQPNHWHFLPSKTDCIIARAPSTFGVHLTLNDSSFFRRRSRPSLRDKFREFHTLLPRWIRFRSQRLLIPAGNISSADSSYPPRFSWVAYCSKLSKAVEISRTLSVNISIYI